MSRDKITELVNIALLSQDIQDLLEILDFASRAAVVLAHSELQKGSGITGAAQMNRIARNAKELAFVVTKHADVGEPTDGQTH